LEGFTRLAADVCERLADCAEAFEAEYGGAERKKAAMDTEKSALWALLYGGLSGAVMAAMLLSWLCRCGS
jgi:hypothetical protein